MTRWRRSSPSPAIGLISETAVQFAEADGSPKRIEIARALDIFTTHVELCLSKLKEIHG